MDTQLKERIDKMIASEPVFLFMKGNPTFPQCGFSNQVVQILKGFDIPFGHCNVLDDQDVRQGIKEYSDWPTIPQLYIGREFVGGCDLVRETWESGDLEAMLKETFPDKEIKAPKPPAKPKHISVEDAKAMLEKGEGIKFYDVRTDEERNIAKIDGFVQLTQEEARNILDNVDKETPMVFMCHFSGRSAQAAEFFAQNGFQKVNVIIGGIDAWAEKIDTSMERY